MFRLAPFNICLVVFSVLLWPATYAFAILQPDELVLVVNTNVPQSRALAEYYAKLRHVPEHRIVALNIPASDEISAKQYENDVYRPVREFLLTNNLQDQVKCLVTFYGVPLRVGPIQLTRDEQLEINDLRNLTVQVRPQIDKTIEALEEIAQKLDPTFTPTRRPDIDALAGRSNQALSIISGKLNTLNDPAAQQEIYQQVMKIIAVIGGERAVAEQESQLLRNPNLPPEQRERIEQRINQLGEVQQRLLELQSNRSDASARAENRELVQKHFGLLPYAELLEGQLNYFKTGESAAALDSELALLWWPYYNRSNWLSNPLYYERYGQPHPPVVMVSRLDAPQAGEVSQMLLASLLAEKQGLQGRVAIDARGIAPVNEKGQPDGYGQFDQTLRNLAELVQKHTTLSLTFDDHSAVFPPHSVKDVAIYAGWYSVRHYIPAFTFVPGAVGYHIASFELTTLRDPDKNEWVKGLIEDGIAATLGPVAEPYTIAFPRPDRFFPLLFTGKLTLAEVYWRTQPTISWRVALVGDPLYRPYMQNPAMQASDLPPSLGAAIQAESAITRPSGSSEAP